MTGNSNDVDSRQTDPCTLAPTRAVQWLGVGLAAVLVRTAILLAGQWEIGPLEDLHSDPDSYRWIAETLARTGVFAVTSAEGTVEPTAFRPPLYPWLLSWLVIDGKLAVGWVGGFHVFLGSLTVVATSAIVQREAIALGGSITGSRNVAFLAAALVALDPLLGVQSTLVMTETLAAAFAVGAWWLTGVAWKRSWIGNAILGSVLAAGFLCRPVFLIWTCLLTPMICFRGWSSKRGGGGLRFAFRQSLTTLPFILGTLIVIAAWTARNLAILGAPVWATTHGGYTLLLGNNPWYYDDLSRRGILDTALWGPPWDPAEFHDAWFQRVQAASLAHDAREGSSSSQTPSSCWVDREVSEDREAALWAKETIRSRPVVFFQSCCVRFLSLWSPLPRSLDGDGGGWGAWAVGGYYVVIYGLAGLAMLRFGASLGRFPWLVGFALVVALSVVHCLYWSNIRMRSPAQPVVIALASLGLLTRSRAKECFTDYPADACPGPRRTA